MSFNTAVVCPLLIGREALLASFESVFEQLSNGQGQTVLVSGEAGIGKSRLVAEVRERLGQGRAQFLQGACFEQERTLPFAPLLDALRSLLLSDSRETFLLHLAPLAPEFIKILPDLALWLPKATPTTALEPEQEKRRLFVALSSFLFELTNHRPLVLIIEDVHWSDDTSIEFLLFLTRHLRSHPLLLLLTYRSEEAYPTLAHFLSTLNRSRVALEYSLTPLTMEEVQAMLRAIFQMKRPVRREFLEALYSLTEGNPFFVEEVIKSLLATGDIFFTGSFWDRKPLSELHIPRSIYDAVQQRVNLLPTRAKQMLELAAVVGRHLDFSLLQVLTQYSETELVQVIETLIVAQLLVETSAEQYAFRHALTQQAVYTGILARKRKILHLRIAQEMERLYASTLDTHLAELAYHFSQAHIWTQVLEYRRRIGEKSLAMYSPHEALEHLASALEASSHLPEANPIPLYLARGQTYEHLGNFEAAQSDFANALEFARTTQDRLAEWQILMEFGSLWIGYDYPHAGDFFQRALDLAWTLADPQKYARSQNRLANWLANTGQPARSIAMHEEALAVFQQHGETHELAQTFEFLGLATALYGNPHRSVSYYDRAIALLRTLDDQRSLISCLVYRSNVASPARGEPVLSAQGTLASCQQDLEEALSLATTIEWREGQVLVHLIAGCVFASYGILGEGLTYLRTALEIATEIESPQWMADSHCSIGEVHLLLLDSMEAIAQLEAGQALARPLGSVYWTENITASLAQAYLLAGNLSRAEAALEHVMPREQTPRNLPERRIAWLWCELALAQHQPDMALCQVDDLLASAPSDTQRTEGQSIPALLKLRGEALWALGQTNEAIDTLEMARRGAQKQGVRPLLWQVHRSLGHTYAALHQKQLAQQEFAAARKVIAELAASLEEVELRERFVQTALSSLPKEQLLTARQSAKHAFDSLTERECEIALLIAQGRSNREIAQALVISQRTVGTHIGHMYAKLGFSTRVQLVTWAVEKGLILSSL